MADAVYDKFKEQILQAGIDLSTVDVRCALIDATDYTFSQTHEFLSDVPAASREEASGAMTSKTFTNGNFDAANVTFSATAGDACDAVLFYVHTGVDATARLICYIDSLSGLPVTLGGDVTLNFDASGIIKI